MSDYTSVQKQFKYLRMMISHAAFSLLQADHLICHLFLQEILILSLLCATLSPGGWRGGSVQFIRSVVSGSLRPRGLQHARLPYPSPTSRVWSNSCPLSQWCHPTISSSVISFSSSVQSCLASFFFLFHWVVSSFRWPKYWSFSFSISPANECSGLVSFRIDWLELLAVQGTLKSLLQHYSSKVSILQHSPFFIVQLSHPYMTTGKTIALGSGTMKNPSLYGVQVHILLVKAAMALTKNWWMQK